MHISEHFLYIKVLDHKRVGVPRQIPIYSECIFNNFHHFSTMTEHLVIVHPVLREDLILNILFHYNILLIIRKTWQKTDVNCPIVHTCVHFQLKIIRLVFLIENVPYLRNECIWLINERCEHKCSGYGSV